MTSLPSASLKSCTGTSRLSWKEMWNKHLQGHRTMVDLRERDPCGFGQLMSVSDGDDDALAIGDSSRKLFPKNHAQIS
jgi:hypothetical protein